MHGMCTEFDTKQISFNYNNSMLPWCLPLFLPFLLASSTMIINPFSVDIIVCALSELLRGVVNACMPMAVKKNAEECDVQYFLFLFIHTLVAVFRLA